MREKRVIAIPEGLAGERIDSALARLLGLSRTVISSLIDDNEVTINSQQATKSDRVAASDHVEVLLPEPQQEARVTPTPVAELEIVFDDDHIVVLNKPVGVAAHPSPGWHGPTVSGALLAAGYTVSTSGAPERQGIVHRLDVGTSGLMVVAKTERAYTGLKDQFRFRTVKKIYHALAQGHMDPSTGTIDAPIDRHPRDAYRFAVVADGKPSITHYESLEYFPAATLLSVELETGRTHQIRVHFSALRHPLVGDTIYGADPVLAEKVKLKRPWLHAMTLNFTHPISGESLSYTADYPTDLTAALALLSEKSRG